MAWTKNRLSRYSKSFNRILKPGLDSNKSVIRLVGSVEGIRFTSLTGNSFVN